MTDKNYIVELTDGRKLSLSPKNVPYYPTIQNTIDSPLFDPESPILLNYNPDILFKIFTTNFLQQNHTLDIYVKLTNGLDYLENVDTVKQMMKALVKWFDDPTIIAKLKINKENTKNLIYSLTFEPQGWFLYNTISHKFDYSLNVPTRWGMYYTHVVVSDNLSYVVIWDLPPPEVMPSPQVTIYKDGILIKTQDDLQLDQVSDKMVIDDNGTIYYNINRENDAYIWRQPQNISQFYKRVDGVNITLSNNAQRYLQTVQNIQNIGGFDQFVIIYIVSDLYTGAVISRTIPYNPVLPQHTVVIIGPTISPSPHMDLIVIEYNYVALDPATNISTRSVNYGVWVVDNNTTAWIEFGSEILLISYSEQIIATADPRPEGTGTYNVAIYKRNGSNFELIANIDDIHGRPIAVSEDFLLTTSMGGPGTEQGILTISLTTNINVHKIIDQTIEREPTTYVITENILEMRDIEVYPGPQNSYLFVSKPTAQRTRYVFKKYRIQPYENIEEFLEEKLD